MKTDSKAIISPKKIWFEFRNSLAFMWNCTISELATIQRNITSLLTLPSTKVLVRIIFDLISHGFAVVAKYQKRSEMFSKLWKSWISIARRQGRLDPIIVNVCICTFQWDDKIITTSLHSVNRIFLVSKNEWKSVVMVLCLRWQHFYMKIIQLNNTIIEF